MKNNKIDNKNGLTSTYIAAPNQNIYDIAVDIHGTIDGVSDLLVNNSWLTLDIDIKGGDKITYTSGVTLDEYEAERLDMFGVVPATQNRNTYYRPKLSGKKFDVFLNKDVLSFDCIIEFDGEQEISVDWGDNSDIEVFKSSPAQISHSFYGEEGVERTIRFYIKTDEVINIDIKTEDLINIMVYNSINTRFFSTKSNMGDVRFFNLLTGIQRITASNISPETLAPLSKLITIQDLDITSSKIKPKQLDEFFISLVKNYGERLPATIKTTTKPNGDFKEPNIKNMPQNGMEAVWMLVNEPAWNTDYHQWHIIIDGIDFANVEEK